MKRILVWGLSNNRAGTECVIEAYVKASDPKKYCFDFLCYDTPETFSHLYSSETLNRTFTIPIKIKHPIKHKLALERFMKEHASEYDAVWFNANDISNIDILKSAKKHGIKHRILHSHNGNIPRRLVTRVFSRFNAKTAEKVVTDRWACSKAAGDFMFGGEQYRIIPNMVDASRYSFNEEGRNLVRSNHQWDDFRIVGTIGRLSEQKNQAFLIELMQQLVSRISNIKLVIVGEGEKKDTLLKYVQVFGVEERVEMLPVQKDIPSLLSAFDCFVLPSLYEGLPLAALEAQYNGLPCVVSDGVSKETAISNNIQFISLEDTKGWIDAISNAQRKPDSLIPEKAHEFDAANINSIADQMFEFE